MEFDTLDRNGHGTHVAGVISGMCNAPLPGATGKEAVEFTGIAPQAKLYGFKVLDDDGNGRDIGRDAVVQVVETALQFACLSAKFFQRQLQFAALTGEAVQFALSDGNVALHFLELVGCAGALVFGGSHLLAQGVDLFAQFLEIGAFFRNVGLAWSRGLFLGC